MSAALELTVPGLAIPQGSMRLVQGGRRMIHSNAQLPGWRALVANHLLAAIIRTERTTGHGFPLTGAVDLAVTFNFNRPRNHYRSGKHSGHLRPVAPKYMQTGPDLDKLVRAIGDSLTSACAIVDDKQIHLIHCAKRWIDDPDTPPFTTITIWNGDQTR